MDIQTVVQKLVRHVEDEIAKYPRKHVLRLRVHISELSGIEPKTLCLEYAKAIRDGPLRGTSLSIDTEVPDAVCDQCGNKFRFEDDKFECDKCGSLKLSLHHGEEFHLDSVSLED